MRVKVIRQFLNGRKIVHEGDIIEVHEHRAAVLERHHPPLVVREIGSGSVTVQQVKPVVVEGANAGNPDPTNSPPTGGQTGEAKPVSSSRRVPARKTQESSGRGAKRGSSR